MRTIAVTLYTLEELPEESRRKALEEHRTVNVEYAWWDVAHMSFAQELASMGLKGEKFHWDLHDRSFYCADLEVGDIDLFLRSVGYPDLRLQEARMLRAAWEHGDLTLRTERLSHRFLRNRLEVFTGRRNLDEDAEGKASALLRRFEKACLEALEREHEYMTSDEAVAETLIANGYEFSLGGRRLRLEAAASPAVLAESPVSATCPDRH